MTVKFKVSLPSLNLSKQPKQNKDKANRCLTNVVNPNAIEHGRNNFYFNHNYELMILVITFPQVTKSFPRLQKTRDILDCHYVTKNKY